MNNEDTPFGFGSEEWLNVGDEPPIEELEQELTHRMKCLGGRYICEEDDCEEETLNIAVARMHTLEENDLDEDIDILDLI